MHELIYLVHTIPRTFSNKIPTVYINLSYWVNWSSESTDRTDKRTQLPDCVRKTSFRFDSLEINVG